MATNERLNDGLSAVLKSVNKLEIKGRSLQAMYDDMRILVNAQERRIRDLDNKVNFYSQSLVKLEGEKADGSRIVSTLWNNALQVKMTKSRCCSIVWLLPRKVVAAVGRVLLR